MFDVRICTAPAGGEWMWTYTTNMLGELPDLESQKKDSIHFGRALVNLIVTYHLRVRKIRPYPKYNKSVSPYTHFFSMSSNNGEES